MHRAWPALLGALCGAPALAYAGVRDAPLAFAVPPLAPGEAALAIGLRAGVSVGLGVGCHGPAAGLQGRYDAHAAFDRVLAGSDCRAVWVDAQTVRIERRPSPAARRDASAPAREPVSPSSLAEVVVTASKRGLGLEALPGSATVVSTEALSEVYARDTSDLRLLASGVTVTNLGPGRDKVLLRGLSDGAFTGHTQSTVGLYWNGAPTTYNAPDPDLRLVDVKSVDVLRGPQGTLYGAGALGGVIDTVPNPPDPSRASGALAAMGAATASGGPSAGLEGVLNAPLPDGKAALRLVAYGEADGGWIELPLRHVADANGVQETGFRAALALAPGPAWTVTLGDTYQDIYSADTQYTTNATEALQRDTLVREPHENDFEQAYVDVRGRGAWGEVRSLGAFTHHDFSSRYDASLALSDFGASVAPAAYDDRTLIRLTSEELDYRSPSHGPLTLLLGGFGSYGDEQETTALAPIGGAALYSENRTDRLVDLAVFGEASYALGSRLTLTAGLRLAYAERRTLSRVTQGDDELPFKGRIVARQSSPKLAADYAFGRGLHTYALVTRGYRIGGFNTAGPLTTSFAPTGGPQPNRTFSPDSLWNYELGLKLQAWRGRLEGRTAVYYDIWRGLQADQFLPSGLPYVANVGAAHIGGWEWETSAHPIAALTLGLGALFTTPELRKVDPSFPSGQSDFTLPGVARRSLDGRVAFSWALGEGRSFDLDAAALYVGHSYLFFGPQGSTIMGHYLDGRVQGVLHMEPWDLALLLTNPVNNRGDTFAFGNPFSLAAGAQRTPLRPRTVGLRLQRAF